MTDSLNNLSTSQLLHTGKGVLRGLVVSNNDTNPILFSCYDNTSAASPLIFRAYIAPASAAQPFTVFFQDRYAPRFETGLYIKFSTDSVASANVWWASP